jgi:hypothetical protein
MIRIVNTGTTHTLNGMRIKAQAEAIRVGDPITALDERGFKSCCYSHLVLSDGTDDSYTNDISSFLFTKISNTDDFSMKLVKAPGGAPNEYDLNDDTYGTFYDFGSLSGFPKYKGYKVDWSKVYNLIGTGDYYVEVDGTFIGVPTTFSTESYRLRTFSFLLANGTVRVETVMNGYLGTTKFDYSGLNWVNQIRLKGFFGNRTPEYERDFIKYQNRNLRQIRDELINMYKFQSGNVPSCVTKQIIDYHFLADEIYISDYNSNNHDYELKSVAVIPEGNDEVDYNSYSRGAILNYTFKDRVQDKLKETV